MRIVFQLVVQVLFAEELPKGHKPTASQLERDCGKGTPYLPAKVVSP